MSPSQLTGRLPMRHTGITSALILSIWLAGLTSIVSSKGINTSKFYSPALKIFFVIISIF